MPRLAANLTLLFAELPAEQRIGAAAAAGFEGVEILFPAEDDPDAIAAALARHGLPLVLINCPVRRDGDGPPGCAADPAATDRFRAQFENALALARRLGAARLHVMSGPGQGPAARAAFTDNLRWAAARAPDMALSIEPINRRDMPGYFLSDFDLAAAILEAVGAPNLSLQFDIWHAHVITGDVLGTFSRHRDRIGHIQIAGLDGRHEPGPGAFDFAGFFKALDAGGYPGWVSAEYRPAGPTAAGLGWMAAYC